MLGHLTVQQVSAREWCMGPVELTYACIWIVVPHATTSNCSDVHVCSINYTIKMCRSVDFR